LMMPGIKSCLFHHLYIQVIIKNKKYIISEI
jgi:hypothetical protein